MMLQTDNRLPPVVKRYGCYLMSLGRIAEMVTGLDLDPEDITDALAKGKAVGIDANCYLANPELTVNYFVKDLDSKGPIVRQIGMEKQGKTEFWPYYERKGIKDFNFIILKRITQTGFHFTLAGPDGVEVYNPDPTVKCFSLHSQIFYRIMK